MSDPFEIIDDAESPSGKSLVVRGVIYRLGVRDSRMTDAEWMDKIQAKADYFAAVSAPP